MDFRGGPVLGIESSCDETSAAVVSEGRVTGHVILSQDAHAVFGGVVPEIARAAEEIGCLLAVSFHATTDEVRDRLDGLAGLVDRRRFHVTEVEKAIGADGAFAEESLSEVLSDMLTELEWFARVLTPARQAAS